MVFREIGFLVSLALFVTVIFSVLTHSIFANLSGILVLFAVNLAIHALANFTKLDVFLELKNGSKGFGELLSKVIVSIALVFVYVFGVGFVWIVSRVLGKKFIDLSLDKKSNWINREKKEIIFEEMF